jgi:hypothetical protein
MTKSVLTRNKCTAIEDNLEWNIEIGPNLSRLKPSTTEGDDHHKRILETLRARFTFPHTTVSTIVILYS